MDVYVVDTGIQASHSEFNGNVEAGVDFNGADGYAPTNPCGGFINRYNGGHGTAVASLIGGQTVGVARGVRLFPVKVARCKRNPDMENPEILIDALGVHYGLDWILGRVLANPLRRAVVNMSFYFDAQGPYCQTPTGPVDCRPTLEHNIRRLLDNKDNNVVVVASANNQRGNHCAEQTPARMGYGGAYEPPAGYARIPLVITVGGTNRTDQRHRCLSCLENDAGSNRGPCVSIYAPAWTIMGAHIAAPTASRNEQTWVDQWNLEFNSSARTVENITSGTSFSAAVVSGIVARLRQTYPNKTALQVWEHIAATATPLPTDFDGDGVAANDRLAYISVYE